MALLHFAFGVYVNVLNDSFDRMIVCTNVSQTLSPEPLLHPQLSTHPQLLSFLIYMGASSACLLVWVVAHC